MKRDFVLPEEDREFLESLGLAWETVASGENWVVIHDCPIPAGYTIPKVRVGLKIEPAYPQTQIDMVYFLPALVRSDGKVIKALSEHAFNGEQWQRWSRHRTAQNPWRPGVDNIEMHIALVNHWLKRELVQ